MITNPTPQRKLRAHRPQRPSLRVVNSPEHQTFLARHLTPRDRWLTRMLFEHKVFTTHQIVDLAFPSPRSANLRLRNLHSWGVFHRFQLNTDQEAPWADQGHGGLSAAKLSRLLREYGIRSGTFRFPDGSQAKGYRRAEFEDTWTRYCPPPEDTEGDPYQPYQASQPSTQRYASPSWYGSSRTTEPSRTNLTSNATDGTAGTATPGGDL